MNVTKNLKLSAPVVHLNGTGKTGLLDMYRDQYEALSNALRVLSQTGPHARDFYILKDGDKAFADARIEHYDRMARIENLMKEVLEITKHIVGE
jgi:hypothetical protein